METYKIQVIATIVVLAGYIITHFITKIFVKNTLKQTHLQRGRRKMITGQPNKDNGLQERWTRTPAPNSGLAKVAVQCSADTFVVKIATFAKPQTVVCH